jgi:dTDP-4-dehydrorhamnose reductase
LNVYGESKLAAEQRVSEATPHSLIIRTSSFFGPWDRYNFVYAVINSLENEQPFTAASDIVISPTYVPDLVNRTLDLFIDAESGIWHLANNSSLSWYELAQLVRDRKRSRKDLIKPLPSTNMNWVARRPAYSALKSERGNLLPDIDHALERYFREQCIN